MRRVVVLVGFLVIVVGIVGIVAPSAILDLTGSLLTPTAIYIIAAIRVASVSYSWAPPGSPGLPQLFASSAHSSSSRAS